MAITFTLKGGEKTFDLIYDAAAAVTVAALPESVTEEAQPRPLWHAPAGGSDEGNELVEVSYDDGRWPLLVQVGPADDWSDLQNELTILRRICQQAQAHARGETWADEVYIEAKPSAAASSTYYTVKLVEDRSGGFLTGTRVATVTLEQVAVTMTVAPCGYGDEETLNNEHRNGHMLIESATAGLAQELAVVGTPTVTLDTGTRLIGAQSQKVVTDTSTSEGVMTGAISITGGQDAVGYAWIYHAGGDALTIEIQENDGGYATLQSKTLEVGDAGGVSDKSYIDADGNTWYRVSVSGTTATGEPGAIDVRLRVYRSSGNATQITTFFTDGWYVETNRSSPPEAWADFPQVYNRNDPSSANPERVNRFDVWGIPGDMPAWIEMLVDTPAPAGVSYMTRAHISLELMANDTDMHIIDSDDFDNGWNQTADAACNGGNFDRLPGASTLIAERFLEPGIYDDIYCVLVRARTSNTNTQLWLRKTVGVTVTEYDEIVFSATDRWQFHFAGIVDMRLSAYRQAMGSAAFELELRPNVQAGETLDFDYVLLLPVQDLVILDPVAALISGDDFHIVGRERVILGNRAANVVEEPMPILGGLWTAWAGILNRFIFAFWHEVGSNASAENDECIITWDSLITFTYRPRTRGFLP